MPRRHMVMDTEGVIEVLRDNLRDRYKDCFSIVQELLQNADDAKARHVHFAMSEGLAALWPHDKACTCQLLKSPALVVVNDGPVSRSDIDAIFRVAAGNKRADTDKIGKFGLGMKSVFHVCEGFFMFGKGLDAQEDLPEICTPWSEEYHKEWWEGWENEKTAAVEIINKLLVPVVAQWPRWFCVWIPMRNTEQLGRCAPILKVTPNEDTYKTLTGAASSERASRMLPLLKNVEEVSFCDLEGNCLKYKMKEGSTRLSVKTCDLAGEVTAEGIGATGYTYSGRAVLHDGEKEFTELQELGCWPESTHKERLMEAERIVDKTKPHAAVCILKEKTPADEKSRVNIVPCVFLPLSGAYDRKDEYSKEIEGDSSVTICLHGSMFVDAGRQNWRTESNLEQLPVDETQLRLEWNKRLFLDGVLPLFIPELFKAMEQWDDDTVDRVIRAIQKVKWLEESFDEICRLEGIVPELTADSRKTKGYVWKRIKGSDTVYEIGRNSATSPLVRRVIVDSLPEGVHVIDKEAGRLYASRKIFGDFPPELCREMLKTIAGMPEEESDNEKLRQFAQGCASQLDFQTSPDWLRCAKIWKVGSARYSYEQITQKSDSRQLYCDSDTGLKTKLLDAVEWEVESIPKELCHALGINVCKLDNDFIVDVLFHKPVLKGEEARRDLMCELKNGGCRCHDRLRKAIRYLIHGSKELFENTSDFYSPDSSLPQEFAEVVLKAISAALCKSSYSIPLRILSALSDSDREEYGFKKLTCDSVAVALAETPGVDYSRFPDDAWQTLLKVSDRLFSDDCVRLALKAIPIYPYEDGSHGALSESCYFEKSVKVPAVFRSMAHILAVPQDDDIANRLGKLLRSWRYSDTFEFCRKVSLPIAQLSSVLLDAVNRTPSLTPEDMGFVQATKWVPMDTGAYCSPNQVIDIPDFTPPPGSTEMIPSAMIDENVLKILRRHDLIPDTCKCVQALFSDFARHSQYHIGLLDLSGGETPTCDALWSMFSNRSTLPILPVLANMERVKNVCDSYLRQLQKPVEHQYMPGVLMELTHNICDCREPQKAKRLWSYLCSYLEEVSAYDEALFRSILAECHFLNMNLKRCKASELCTGGASVPSSCIINDEYRAAQRFFARLHDNKSYVSKDDGQRHFLFDDYFNDWDEDFNARIGGFIVAISDRKEHLDLVRRRYWTDARNIKDNRNKICENYDEIVNGQNTYLYAKKGRTIVVRSIIGTNFETPMRGLNEVDNLLIAEGKPLIISPSPEFRRKYVGGENTLRIHLRALSAEELASLGLSKLNSLLKNTLEIIVSELIGGYQTYDIDNFWDNLANEEQMSINVTRSIMLNHATYYLGMLGCNDEKLYSYFSRFRDLETILEDAKRSKGDGWGRHVVDKERLLREFGNLIETDTTVQRNILGALRNEMRNRYEYSEWSILQELFQNADDAAEQLHAADRSPDTMKASFEVRYDGNNLIIVHWGRLINSRVSSEANLSDNREFARDLENMLLLMQSGKKNAKISVTGKFGLGFKTVFFVCDEPVVYSGRLRFKIVAGFLPRSLSEDDNARFLPKVKEFADVCPEHKPTVIILPIVPEKRELVEKCLARFADDASRCCSLAKRIRQVVVNGRSVVPAEDSNDQFTIDLGDGKLFFAKANGLPAALPKEIPTYWAVVPTRLKLDLGFALNGDLDLTTGRAKLNDSSEKNPRLVMKWSCGLHSALKKMDGIVRMSEDKGYAFFSALWDLFTVRKEAHKWDNPETGILRDLLWDPRHGGYRTYLNETNSIPSGLDGIFHVLCKPSSIRHVVSTNVSRHRLTALLGHGTITPSCAVSEDVCRAAPGRFLGEGARKYGMVDFLNDLLVEHQVLDCKWCSSGSGKTFLDGVKAVELDEEAKEVLRRFRFTTNGGTANIAERLACKDSDEKRPGFVPLEYQLSDQYDETGVAIFNMIRGERKMSPEQLSGFAVKASNYEEQAAVLRYVLEANDIDFVRAFKDRNPTWLNNIVTNPYFKRLDVNQRLLIAGMLDLGVEVIQTDFPAAIPSPAIEVRELDWSAVSAWWKCHATETIRKYNAIVYDRESLKDLPHATITPEQRSEWLELFVLAAAFSLGMRDCQHKGFIRMLKNTKMKGHGSQTLWQVYCDKGSKPQDWMNTLEYFVEQEEFIRQYRYWMGLFMRIYQFASNLDSYVEYLHTFNDLRDLRSLESIMAIKTNPALSGTGIDLPGLQHALCARGQAFLVRELIRRNYVDNKIFYPYCFVPNPTLFGEKDSRSIYNSASYKLKGEDPTFDKCFDMALVSYMKEEKEANVWYVF